MTVNYRFRHRPGGGKKITQSINEVTTAGMAQRADLSDIKTYDLITGAL